MAFSRRDKAVDGSRAASPKNRHVDYHHLSQMQGKVSKYKPDNRTDHNTSGAVRKRQFVPIGLVGGSHFKSLTRGG